MVDEHTQSPTNIAPAALNDIDAARYVGLSCGFLRAARVGRCNGPSYIRAGRAVRYLISDLDVWLESRRVGKATK
jgi:hypothetical protein